MWGKDFVADNPHMYSKIFKALPSLFIDGFYMMSSKWQ